MSHDDFAFEPIPGLPEALPEGERMLWQGRPNWWRLAVESLGLKWVAGYFILLAFWRWATLVEPMGLGPALVLALPFVVSGLIVVGFIALFAWVQARATLYTITTARVVMRIGAAMSVTLQFPFSKIASADLDLRRGGTGTVALQLSGACPLGYAMCWPHVLSLIHI